METQSRNAGEIVESDNCPRATACQCVQDKEGDLVGGVRGDGVIPLECSQAVKLRRESAMERMERRRRLEF
jgi:hypothetical protein